VTQPVLWTAFETAGVLPAWHQPVPWLTPFENARLARFKVPKRRDDWLLGRFTVKGLIQKAVEAVLLRTLTPDAFEIVAESSGAPFARLVSGERLPLSISISHSHGTAFCAVMPSPLPGGTIGADLELIEPRSERFVRDFFTPAETAAWKESLPAEQALLANSIWSAKEAVLKALGLGLTVDTRGVDIHLSDEPADGPLRPREGAWRRFDAVCAAGIDVDEIPLSGLWSLRGRFVVTLAARLPATPGKDRHVSH